MCDPVTIAVTTAAVSAASSIMGFEGADAACPTQNANAANATYANSYNALEEQRGQIDAQASENSVSALIDRVKAHGAISASASSMGTGGATSKELANAADFDAGRSLSIENLNSQGQRLQTFRTNSGPQTSPAATRSPPCPPPPRCPSCWASPRPASREPEGTSKPAESLVADDGRPPS
jgi:hypothetical protein